MRRIKLAAIALLLAACTQSSTSGAPSFPHPSATSPHPSATALASSPAPRGAGGLPNFSHVVVVVMENHEYSEITGSSQAPYINSLAHQYALATNYSALSHPSLPNYLAMIGGSSFGVHSDCTDCPVSAVNLVDQLEGHAISWKAYMEDMPSPCFTGPGFQSYAKKHDPFMYFDDITRVPSRCDRVVPLTQLTADLANHALPRFAFITPNLCHDMHDCDPAQGDMFLSRLLPPILSQLGTSGALFLTWDEGHPGPSTTPATVCCPPAQGGHVVMIAAGPAALKGVSVGTEYTHYSLLRTIEDAWGLQRIGLTACSCIKPMTDLFS